MRRFSPAGDDDATAQTFSVWRQWDCGGEVHVQCHGTNNPVRVIHQPNEVAQGRFAAHIEHALERRMVVTFLADLNEEDAVVEIVHHLLPAPTVPPFDGVVVFSSGGDDPVGRGFAKCFLYDGGLRHFIVAQVDVAFEGSGPDAQAKLLVQILDEPVNEMIRRVVAAMNERVVADHRLHVGILLVQGSDLRIVLPERRAGSAHVRQESTGVSPMQIPDRRREHHDVPWRQVIFKHPLFHDSSGVW